MSMSIDPLSDDTFTLTQAAKRLPRLRAGRPVNPSTLWRWALRGVRGVKLETAMVGGVRVTSEAALRRFFGTLSAGFSLEPSGASACNAAASHRQNPVEQELDELGLR
jgi:hypothetical protein